MQILDVTTQVCPMTYVMVKAKLEEVTGEEKLLVRLQGKKTLQDIVTSLQTDGYAIGSVSEQGSEQYQLLVKAKQSNNNFE